MAGTSPAMTMGRDFAQDHWHNQDGTEQNPGYDGLSISGDFIMALNTDRIDDAVLALLYLGLHNEYRAWKGFDWEAMGRLHDKGMIDNPVGKAKSVCFTEEGLRRSRELFEAMFRK
jgi:Domain of unknown function (DUF6429)